MISGNGLNLARLKHLNRDVVFRLLREHQQTTRTDLVRLSGLSKATVSEIVETFQREGFIREVGKQQPARGRSQVILEFDPMARLVLGAQLVGSTCTVVLADLTAQLRHRSSRPMRGTAPEDFVEAICAGVEELRPLADVPILGVGVGTPTSVDPAGRRVTLSVPYGWRDVPLADLIEDRLALPTLIANRAKVAALGEVWQGAHDETDNLLYVYVGNGIMAGLVLNGSLYFGSSGTAGELGHMTVLPDGPLCGCGNRGCLHTLSSESAIVHRARSRVREAEGPTYMADRTDGVLGEITLPLVLEAAAAGDRVALETLTEAATYLGIALANVINLVNPSIVVVGGPTASIGETFLEPVRHEVRRRALGDSLHDLAIVPSVLGDDAGAIGAAALVLENLETIPGSVTGSDHLPRVPMATSHVAS
jgi:glucokinase-like ROK family protein